MLPKNCSAFNNMVEHTIKVCQAKVICMLIENVKPRPLGTNPIEIRNFDIDQSFTTVCILKAHQKVNRFFNMLQNMTQNETACLNPQTWLKIMSCNACIGSFIRRIKARDIKPMLKKKFKEIAFSTSNLY